MKYFWKALVAGGVLVVIFMLQRQFAGSDFVQDIAMRGGYFGVFAFAFLNSFNVIVPIIAPTLVPTWVVAGLSFLPIIVVMTLAVSIVDIGFYLVGRFSRGYFAQKVEGNQTYKRLKILQEKNFLLPLLICGLWIIFAPLPNEFVTIPLGLLGYRLLYVGSIIVVGNFVFNLLVGGQALHILS